MASVVKIKRSAVAGKTPTTSDITSGELALNTNDGRLYSSDGSVVFEIGANPGSLTVGDGEFSIANGALTFPTSDGTDGQVLTTDGNGNVGWENVSSGGGITGGFPFYKTDGTQDNISVAGGAFPFYLSDGTLDSIFVG